MVSVPWFWLVKRMVESMRRLQRASRPRITPWCSLGLNRNPVASEERQASCNEMIPTCLYHSKAIGIASRFARHSASWSAEKDKTRVTLYVYPGDAEVRYYRVVGGGHTWPGGTERASTLIVGRTSRDFSASEAIREFFKDKRR